MKINLNTRRAPEDAELVEVLTKQLLFNHLMPHTWRGRTVTVSVMSKRELAQRYGWSTQKLRRRLQGVGLNLGRSKLLLPRQIEVVVRALGPPPH